MKMILTGLGIGLVAGFIGALCGVGGGDCDGAHFCLGAGDGSTGSGGDLAGGGGGDGALGNLEHGDVEGGGLDQLAGGGGRRGGRDLGGMVWLGFDARDAERGADQDLWSALGGDRDADAAGEGVSGER